MDCHDQAVHGDLIPDQYGKNAAGILSQHVLPTAKREQNWLRTASLGQSPLRLETEDSDAVFLAEASGRDGGRYHGDNIPVNEPLNITVRIDPGKLEPGDLLVSWLWVKRIARQRHRPDYVH